MQNQSPQHSKHFVFKRKTSKVYHVSESPLQHIRSSIAAVSLNSKKATVESDSVAEHFDMTQKISATSTTVVPQCSHHDGKVKTVIIMVGLPARGKTYISKKMTRYFNWIGYKTKVFNVGDYRREATDEYTGHEFFLANNEKAAALRLKVAKLAFNDLAEWLQNEGDLAVFDGTNSTQVRRQWIYELCREHQFDHFFVESVCTQQSIIDANILDVKISSPDYQHMDRAAAVADFKLRIQHYEEVYEPLDDIKDAHLSFIKIYNQGAKFLINQISGNIHSRTVYYLMNIKPVRRSIYICRHGESKNNLMGRIGGDEDLSENGEMFAEMLGEFMGSPEVECGSEQLKVWTSHYKRTIQTSQHIACAEVVKWKALNELNSGVCENKTYAEIEQQYPAEFAKRDQDKYWYRYPMGESYDDLVIRLEPIIMRLERESNVLVICHQAVARCLLAYYLDIEKDQLPYIKVPLHCVMKLTPTAYDCLLDKIYLDVDAVDTHRSRVA